MLTEIRLYGPLRARFGRSYFIDVSTPAEAIRALCATVVGFKKFIASNQALRYKFWLTDIPVSDIDQMNYPAGGLIRIVPTIYGSGKFGQILLGGALILASFYIPTTWAVFGRSIAGIAFNVGVSMTLGGVANLLSGAPSTRSLQNAPERPNNLPSYAFNGSVNTTGQGNPVPILYGELIVGSQVISAGLATTSIDTQTSTGTITSQDLLNIFYGAWIGK